MHEVKIDKEKNRLYLILGKIEHANEPAELARKIRQACQSLKTGFTCLTDLRDYELLEEDREVIIEEIQNFLVQAGMAKVVRVVRQFGVWGHLQFDKSSMSLGYHA